MSHWAPCHSSPFCVISIISVGTYMQLLIAILHCCLLTYWNNPQPCTYRPDEKYTHDGVCSSRNSNLYFEHPLIQCCCIQGQKHFPGLTGFHCSTLCSPAEDSLSALIPIMQHDIDWHWFNDIFAEAMLHWILPRSSYCYENFLIRLLSFFLWIRQQYPVAVAAFACDTG